MALNIEDLKSVFFEQEHEQNEYKMQGDFRFTINTKRKGVIFIIFINVRASERFFKKGATKK